MVIAACPLPGVYLLEPRVFVDARGSFFEAWNAARFAEATGERPLFVQENQSRSTHGVLRGLHYQVGAPQGKLVRVVAGEVYDVCVDLRRASPAFGRWYGVTLSADNRRSLWIPAGCAHGFQVLSASAEVVYQTTAPWSPADERCIRFDDPDLAIDWPLAEAPILSARDAAAPLLRDAECFP